MVEGGVEHDERDIQLLGQVLIPLDHRVADVGGAQEEVRHGHVLRLAVLDLRIGQVHPGVRAQVGGIARPLRVGDEGSVSRRARWRQRGFPDTWLQCPWWSAVPGGQWRCSNTPAVPRFGLPGLFVVFPQHLVHPLFGCELGRLLLHGQSSRRFRPGRPPGFLKASIVSPAGLCKTTIFKTRFQNPSYYPQDKGDILWYTVGKHPIEEDSAYEH